MGTLGLRGIPFADLLLDADPQHQLRVVQDLRTSLLRYLHFPTIVTASQLNEPKAARNSLGFF